MEIIYTAEDSVTRRLRIDGTNRGSNFDNDFEMYELTKQDEILLMTYEERLDEKGYRVVVLSRGILEKGYIKKMLHGFLPLLDTFQNAQLIINE